MKKIKIIIGATAVGKTKWAIEYAVRENAEIISSDSMQIYHHMDIGTAKPSKEDKATVPHHLIDIVYPDEAFAVYDFVKLANQNITEINSRQKEPIIVGGTGLYLNAFIRDFQFPHIPKDPDTQQKLKARAKQEGTESLYQELSAIDENSAKKISKNDIYRIARALEVYYLTGQKLSDIHQKEKEYRKDIEIIWLQKNREDIYKNIETRVDYMIRAGLFEEVEFLLKKGYNPSLASMQALGYKESVEYLAGKLNREDCIEVIKKRTRNFAKRQLTWFRSFPVAKEIEL